MLEWLQTLEKSGYPWTALVIEIIACLYIAGIGRIVYDKITKKKTSETLFGERPGRVLTAIAAATALMLIVSYEVDHHAPDLAKLCQKLGYAHCELPAEH